MPGPPGSIASLGGGGGGASPGAGVNVDQLERTGRRVSLLQRHAPELVSSSVSGALALAESNTSDEAMLGSATDAIGYANIQRLHADLQDEGPEAARGIWASTPPPLQQALRELGYEPPKAPERKRSNRWGINLPDILPIDELTIDRDTPIVGPLGNIQAGLGEGLQAVSSVAGQALEPFTWLGEQPAHIYRTWKYQQQEGDIGLGFHRYFSPSEFSKAWHETDNADGYVRPEHRERARKALAGDETAYRLAHYTATGLDPATILEREGLEPGTPEANELAVRYQTMAGTEEFKRAVHELSVGQVSVGRVFAQEFGLDDTDAGWGRFVSGALDATFAVTSDPTLLVAAPLKALRFGRYAFALEDAADVKRGLRTVDIAEEVLRGRSGLPASTTLGPLKPWDMTRGRGVLRWADRVAEGFKTGELSRLTREIPAVETGISAMSDYHSLAAAKGYRDLTTAEGVLDWLRSEQGILGMVGSRIGGSSPVTGMRLPSLGMRDRTALRAKAMWTEGVDWARLQRDPFTGDHWNDYVRNLMGAVGNPSTLVRQFGQWSLAHTAGDAGRVIAALTSHTPYQDVLPLFGNQAVPEFKRLVNSGIFAGFSRQMMDDYIDDFIKHPELTNRSTKVEQFLEQLFELGGVADTDFKSRFVGRYRQAYAVDGGDVLHVGGIETRAARLVDAQHADALAIPNVKQFLAESYRANWLRSIFHNPGSAYIDTRLGRAWKPSVLMRIGFIPRAAGEELFHFVLKHGPRTYLGAKGAEWVVNEELAHNLRARLTEAEALGQTDAVSRIQASLADATGALPPVRALMAGADRMFGRLFESSNEAAMPWRRRLADKMEALDERGVVTGLERWANQHSIWASDAFDKVTKHPFVPSKAKLGEWMAYHWNPDAAIAARDMIEHPWVMRAFAEQISGSTLSPLEFRNAAVLDGQPVAKVRIGEIRGGIPVVEEVPLRPMPGQYGQINRVATQDQSFYNSIYARHNWIKHDRVGNSVLSSVLPRYVGGEAFPRVSRRLGYGTDLGVLRGDLNTAWAHGDGGTLLWHLRRYIDGVEPDAGTGWLGAQLKRHFADAGTGLSAGKLLAVLDDPRLDTAAKRWLLYENVDPALLVDDFPTLVRKARGVAKARLSHPDMQRHLSESRMYANGGPTLATPIERGMHKAYVPLMPADYTSVGLGEDFIALATQRIVRIGGYHPDRAEAIARRVAATSLGPDPGMALKPLAAWASSDPRVADAIMAAAEQVTGIKPTFGILAVPEEVIQRSAGDFPQGMVTDSDAWQTADDWTVEPWRLRDTTPTTKSRRLVELEVNGEWWDDAALDAATTAWGVRPAGTSRWHTFDGWTWHAGDPPPPGGTFWFVDHPGTASPPPEALLDAHKLPGIPGPTGWTVTAREVSPGLGEAEALDQVGNATVDELLETLTTAGREDIDEDVLHEIVEPLLRPDRHMTDEAGNKVTEPGYTWEHLVAGTKVDRLPVNTYGPEIAAARGMRWSKFVQEFFSGPVNRAISSVVRKPMFLEIYGQQLRNTRVVADLFVEPTMRSAALTHATSLGIPEEAMDDFALNAGHIKTDDGLIDLIRTMAGDDTLDVSDDALSVLRTFAAQRNHGLDLARENALNRAFQLITPFIDDHSVRSAFQNYVGNFIPFLFAEEQFLKRWARSVYESPEMVRKAQLMMNGFRSMGTVRTDSEGNETFVYPLIGEAVQVAANMAPTIFGVDLKLPYPVQMTGDTGYVLPGIGEQLGTPSVGPLVALGVEFFSRHFPEVADLEDDVLGRGANRPLWQYIVPTSMGNLWQAGFGDMDKGQLASLNLQAIQAMAVNGQLPPEDATPAERERFAEQVRGQVRFLALARGLFGMNAPASPQISFPTEALSEEFQALLQADVPMEEAVLAFLGSHPDADPSALLAVTVSRTETEFSGLDMPTDKAFSWMKEHEDLIEAFPAASSWLVPRADDDDAFSFRAWNQQLALGLRRRKAPDEFLNDIYFTAAARDYFNAREQQEARLLTAQGEDRRKFTTEWDAWKRAYFNQHPVFEDMLSDTTRQQRRRDALDQLTTLAADPESDVVAPEMREMILRFDDYRQRTTLLRGDRRGAVVDERRRLTEELRAWMLWHVTRHPDLSPLYLRTIEPELGETDEDAASTGLVY
jgi:hypothetical protein